jgi:hypothetical protein
MKRSFAVFFLAAALAAAAAADDKHEQGKPKSAHGNAQSAVPPGHGGTPPGLETQDKVPAGLAKKGGMPPGLAKKFGRTIAANERIYVAFDPQRDDRAWFLTDGRWVVRRSFEPALRAEVRQSLLLPAIPHPPVPPPIARLHVVLFGS